jgi:protein TonB
VKARVVTHVWNGEQLVPAELLLAEEEKTRGSESQAEVRPNVPPTTPHDVVKAPRPSKPRLTEPPRVAPLPAVLPPSTMQSPVRLPVEPTRPRTSKGCTSTISSGATDFPFTYYLRQVQAKISERWPPPAGSRGGECAIVLFEIARDGSIKESSLERSSGVTLYDQSALRAVAEASPFPPLPPEFKAPSLRVHFGFEFHPDQG